MKRVLIIFISFIFIGDSFAQKQSEKDTIDAFIKEFDKKMDTVYWLCEYDNIAWWTSDSVYATPKEEQAKLGAEWFCYKDGDLWHAVYGKYEMDDYDMIYHYIVDSNQNIKRVNIKIDSGIANSFCRALKLGSKELNNYPDSIKVRFNQYIKRNQDNSITLWYLPAFTTNGIAVYGGEFIYNFDNTGNHIISKSEFSHGYKGFKPDPKREIWLDYNDLETPSLGSIFFVWYYRKYFDRIVIDAKKFKSTVFHDEKGFYWVHGKKE